MRKRRVLLVGAGGSAGYNFAESLRLSPERFHVAGTDCSREHLELANVDRRYLVPRCTEPGYLDAVERVVRRERVELVHAQPDVEVAFWSRNRHELSAPLFLPSAAAIELCHDKMACNRRLCERGVPAPESHPVADAGSLGRAFESLARRGGTVWVRAVRGAGSRAALPVRERGQAEAWIAYWGSMRGLAPADFMLAEYLPGREFAFQSVWAHGELVTSQARERREYVFGSLMPSGQSSSPSVAVTVNDARVNDIATRAVRAVDEEPNGVYCVDLKEDVDGTPCVTEINIGRFFTTSDFFARAGCNMPYLYFKLALGEGVPPVARYDPLPAGLTWLRTIDMGKKLVGEGGWSCRTA